MADTAVDGARALAARLWRVGLLTVGVGAFAALGGLGEVSEVRGATNSGAQPGSTEPYAAPDQPPPDEPFTGSRITPSVQANRGSAQAAAQERAQRRQSAGAQAARRQSRTQYRGLGRQQALELARSKHPEIVTAPPWSPVHLRDGERAVKFLTSGTALVETAAGTRALLVGSHPLLSTAGGGGSALVDHALEDRGDEFLPRNPLVPLSVSKSLEQGITLPDIGLGVRIEAPTSASAPTLETGKAFWANVATDSDFLVLPVGGGFETVHMLRSEDSPEEFSVDFELPEGASLLVSRDILGGFEVVKDGKTIALVSQPRALDADGTPVAVSGSVAGNRLTMTIPHRDGDYAYPIQLDPSIVEEQRYWICRDTAGNAQPGLEPCPYYDGPGEPPTPDLNGWTFNNQAGGSKFLGYKGHAYLGRGLYTWHDTPLYYNAYDKGEWAFQAPGDSYIFRAEFGYVSHEPEGTALYEGAWSPRKGDWDYGTWDEPSPSTNTGGSPVFMYTEQHYNYKTHCFAAVRCAEPYEDVRDLGNIAVWDMWICCYSGNRNRFLGYMGSSAIFLTDFEDPYVTADEAPPAGWTDANPRMNFTARDRGLGAKRLNVFSPEKADWSGRIDVSSSCDGTRNARCGAPGIYTYINNLPEGLVHIATEGWDILYKYTRTDWPVKVDRTAPTIASFSGTLKDHANGIIGEGSYSVNVTATDGSTSSDLARRSGVKRIALLVNGIEIASSPTQSASCESCPLSHPFTVTDADLGDDGVKTISVIAYDQLNHATSASSNQFGVTLDRNEPDLLLSGDLAASADALLAESSYELLVEAADVGGLPVQVEITLDDIAVSRPTSCSVGSPCSWTLNTASYPEGAHDLSVTVTDGAGHAASQGLSFSTRRIPSLAHRELSSDSTAMLRVDGAAAGDRLGASAATLGDISGDGIDDFAIGAPDAGNNARPQSGTVYIVSGSGLTENLDLASLTALTGYRIDGALPLDHAGASVAAAGDVNGDGVGDLLIGAPGVRDPFFGTSKGSVYVVFGAGSAANIDLGSLGTHGFKVQSPLVTNTTAQAFGQRLAGPRAGVFGLPADVNGDGRDDFVVGSPAEPSTPLDTGDYEGRGRAYVIFGKADNAPVDVAQLGGQGFVIEGEAPDDRAGTSAAIVGDVNGDGFADIAVGAPGNDHFWNPAGGAGHIFYGSTNPQGLQMGSTYPGVEIVGDDNEQLGREAAAVGDVNDDGLADVAFGGNGITRVIYGQDTEETYSLVDVQQDIPLLGFSIATSTNDTIVAGAGDVNGDLVADIILGSPALEHAAMLVTSQIGRSSNFADVVETASMAGQAGTTLRGPLDSMTGASVDGYDRDAWGSPGVAHGAPAADNRGRTNSGSWYMTDASTAAAARSGRACYRTKTTAYAYDDRTDVPYCRIGKAGNRDYTRSLSRCGALSENRCRATKYRIPGKQGKVRASLQLRKPLEPGNVAMPGGFVAWRLYDSANNTIGYVAYNGPTPAKYLRPRDFAFWDQNKSYIGESAWSDKTRRSQPSIKGLEWHRIESTPCMNDRTAQRQGAIIFFDFSPRGNGVIGGAADQPNLGSNNPKGRSISIRAIISRDAFADGSFSSVEPDNDLVLDAYYQPCVKDVYRGGKLAGAATPTPYRAPNHTPWRQEATAGDGAYQGFDAGGRCDKELAKNGAMAKFPQGQFSRNCGSAYRNNEFPDKQQDPGVPQFPPTVMILGSTNGVRGPADIDPPKGAGVSRTILRVGTGVDVNVYDQVGYIDPNVPCGHARSANFQLIRLGRNYGWITRRAGDTLSPPIPAAGPTRAAGTAGCGNPILP